MVSDIHLGGVCAMLRILLLINILLYVLQYLLRVPSSVQQQSFATVLPASMYFTVRVVSSCVICIPTHLGIALFSFV